MNINKLSLASTLVALSVTISLGSCDLLKSPEQITSEKIASPESVLEETTGKDEALSKDKNIINNPRSIGPILKSVSDKLRNKHKSNYNAIYNDKEYIDVYREFEKKLYNNNQRCI
ncbi:MAG: hypothetical protein C4617_03570 [Candidatus Liberibacter europaeus]|uniref:Lipoprotein n=1 Tax=Candidatus Liberibacter europaeus TaxID=744859 RepID=A0A2T4VXI2_9HYPH|nr:hypothetical protein [Candidatus Liberibacter europaeus]PTL86484.1 MAG: hypothetical protein C4617_03570 [Candidatus Liberibacter europaeus]